MQYQPRILIVDDEPGVRDSLRATFEKRSYQVVTATSRAEAERSVAAEKPDAVLLGTIEPRGDAFHLHNWLRETPQYSDIPMIVIDAPEEKQLLRGWRRDEGVRMQADDYLMKPVEPEALVPLVERLLDRTTSRIRVLVADDHAIVRDGIRALLGVQRDIQLVGEAIDGRDAIEKTRELSPDVVLMDIVMPGMNGLEATKQIAREFDNTKVLMLSQYDNEENVRESTQVGAHGFISKNNASTDLLSAIRSL